MHDDWVSGVKTCDKWILSSCYDNTVNIWNLKGKHIVSNNEHTNVVKAISWIKKDDPSGGFVSVSHDLLAILWHWEPGAKFAEAKIALRGHERGIDSVGVNEEGSLIATGGWDTHLKIWSCSFNESENDAIPNKRLKGLITRTPLHTLKGHKETISECLWPEGRTVCTASMDHTVKFWDAEVREKYLI